MHTNGKEKMKTVSLVLVAMVMLSVLLFSVAPLGGHAPIVSGQSQVAGGTVATRTIAAENTAHNIGTVVAGGADRGDGRTWTEVEIVYPKDASVSKTFTIEVELFGVYPDHWSRISGPIMIQVLGDPTVGWVTRTATTSADGRAAMPITIGGHGTPCHYVDIKAKCTGDDIFAPSTEVQARVTLHPYGVLYISSFNVHTDTTVSFDGDRSIGFGPFTADWSIPTRPLYRHAYLIKQEVGAKAWLTPDWSGDYYVYFRVIDRYGETMFEPNNWIWVKIHATCSDDGQKTPTKCTFTGPSQVKLHEKFQLKGTLLTNDGKPVQGEEIRVWVLYDSSRDWEDIGGTKTVEGGHFDGGWHQINELSHGQTGWVKYMVKYKGSDTYEPCASDPITITVTA